MIYVDQLTAYGQAPKPGAEKYFGNGKRSCHMMIEASGDLEELHLFAERIGMRREWFQGDNRHPHYDLTPSRRQRAIEAGAVPVSAFELVEKCTRGPRI